MGQASSSPQKITLWTRRDPVVHPVRHCTFTRMGICCSARNDCRRSCAPRCRLCSVRAVRAVRRRRGSPLHGASIVVEADEEAKVQLVLDAVSIQNSDAPAINIRVADKVFVTTTTSENHFEVTGAFAADETSTLDVVIFSKEDLVLNGTGALEVVSAQGNGITSKDELKITGGVIVVSAAKDGLEANDGVAIAGGEIDIDADADGVHAEDDEDDSVGFVFIAGGAVHITAGDDGIHATTFVQIDAGSVDVEESGEGIEGTLVQISGGDISVFASDDGINASAQSSALNVLIEVNGGTIFVEVGSGDTDAFDANGDIVINDGVIDVVAQSAFDADGSAVLNGGTVTVNGTVIIEIVQTGPGGGGGPGG